MLIVGIILMYFEKVDPTTGFHTNVIEGELAVFCFCRNARVAYAGSFTHANI